MYCPNCGKEIQDDSNFCYKCGKEIKTQVTNEIENKSEYTNSIKGYKWYNAYNYVVIPLLIVLNLSTLASLCSILNNSINPSMLSSIFISIAFLVAFIAIKVALCISMYKKKKGTLKLFKISIYLEFGVYLLGFILNLLTSIIAYNGLYHFIITYSIYILIVGIWIRQNIVYFEKRKDIFIN